MKSLLTTTVFGLSALVLTGCGYPQAMEAHRAQYEMIGMTGYDLQACAGVPGTTKTLNPSTQIWQYTTSYTPPSIPSSGLIPISGVMSAWQAVFGSAGSSCTMIVRINHDRVSEVHYAGNNDSYFGKDGVCSMITRGCARQPEATMHSAGLLSHANVLGGLSIPPTPPQSADATYSEESRKYVPVFDGDELQPVIRPVPPQVAQGELPAPPANKADEKKDGK